MSLLAALPARQLPSAKFRRRLIFLAAAVIYLVGLFAFLRVDPLMLFRDFHYVTGLLGAMVPPNVSLLWENTTLWLSIVETIAMAFLGTLGGSMVALALAILAAQNTTPHPALRPLARGLLAAERSTPNLVVLLVLLIAVGIGPFAGMLSLCVGSVGIFGRLFAEAIEHVDPAPGEAIAASGASRLQVIRYGILPLAAPSILANIFYSFDVNLRAAVALGVLGGGGIGFELSVARSVLRYKDMLAYMILIIILINVMERVADALRSKIFALETQLR